MQIPSIQILSFSSKSRAHREIPSRSRHSPRPLLLACRLQGYARLRHPRLILPEQLYADWKAKPLAQTIPRVAGVPFREWMRAIKGEGSEPGSNFDYAAKLTEIILLGVLAQRFGTRIEWDAKNGRITNHPELNAFVREPVREGWGYGEALWENG